MKSFKEFGMSLTGGGTHIGTTRIIAEKDFSVIRDGGSHVHKVLNSEECGFCQVVQDFSIRSEERGTRGSWYVNLNPPNHIEKSSCCVQDVEFV